MPSIGQTLIRLRTERGISQRELAALLEAEGVQVSNQAVSKWENDSTQPNAKQLLALMRIYGVRDALALFTGVPATDPLSRLNRQGREKVEEYIRDLLDTGRYTAELTKLLPVGRRPVRMLPLYPMAASAGTGQLLEDTPCEMVEVEPDISDEADFGVRLAGNSMEPRYADGQVVWVHRQETLRHGQIGVFLYDGMAYCKRLEYDKDRVRLCSLNPAYDPIILRPGETLTVFGRVVN